MVSTPGSACGAPVTGGDSVNAGVRRGQEGELAVLRVWFPPSLRLRFTFPFAEPQAEALS